MCKESETKQTTTTQMPAWLSAGSEYAVNEAKKLHEKPFEGYTGERVADFSPDQLSAFQKLRDMISGAPDIGDAALTGVAQYGSAPAQNVTAQHIDPETIKANLGDIQAYFNPHTEAALQPALRKIQEAADASRKRVNAGATSARAFGDARHGILESDVDLNRDQATGETASKAYMDMYDKALATLGADVNRRNAGQVANAQFATDADKLNAGFNETALERLFKGSTGLETVAQAEQNRQLQQLQALLGTGALQEGKDQAGMDAAFQEFLRKYGHDFQTLSALTGTLKGVPHDTTSTTVGTQPDNSGLGALGSVAGSVASSPGFWSWLTALGAPASAGSAAAATGAAMMI